MCCAGSVVTSPANIARSSRMQAHIGRRENSDCVRTVSHAPRDPGETPSFTGTPGCISMLREVVDRECVGGIWCASARASGINFQACSNGTSEQADIIFRGVCRPSETWLWNRPWDGQASGKSHLGARERSARSRCSTSSTLPAIAQPSGAKIPGGSPELSSSNSTLTLVAPPCGSNQKVVSMRTPAL